MQLLRVEYKKIGNNKAEIYLFLRDNNRRRSVEIIQNFEPYFYIPVEENITDYRVVRVEDREFESVSGRKLRKIITKLPENVAELRDKVSTSFEADILYPTRFTIDTIDIIEPTTPKILFLDIEVDAVGKIPNVNLAQEPIICISAYCNFDEIYTTFVFRPDLSPGTQDGLFEDSFHEVRYFRSEIDMLESFVEFIRSEEADVITGWNISRFDLPYLVNRLRNLQIDTNRLSPMNSCYLRDNREVIIRGVALIDLYDAYRHFTFSQEESYQLDFIARKVIGKGKTESQSNIRRMWKFELDKLINYNTNDCYLVKAIDEKLRLLDFMDEIRRISFCQLEDTLSASRIIDCYILKLFHNKIVFPTRQHHKKYEYEGAFVETWASGIYENVVSFDLKSLYPSLLVDFNLSPDTMLNEHKDNSIKVGKYNVNMTKKGFLVEVIESLFKERAKYKELAKNEIIGSENWKIYDTRQYVLKTLLNAIYGQTAFIGSRIHDPRIAETITYLGRETIKWSKNIIEDLGYQALYCDTDGLFWTANRQIDLEEIETAREIINSSYSDFVTKYGITKHSLDMQFEKIYRRAFFGRATKKKYAGHCIYNSGQEVDSLEIVGMEVRRSDASQFSRNLQRQILDMILRQDKPKEEVLRYIGSEIDRLRKGKFSFTEIGIPKGINKDLDSYGYSTIKGKLKKISAPANIRGAIYMRDNFGVELSSKPKTIYVSKVPGHPETDVISFDEDSQVPSGVEVDIEVMLGKLVKDKVESIFEAIGWRMSELVPWWKGRAPKQGIQMSFETLLKGGN